MAKPKPTRGAKTLLPGRKVTYRIRRLSPDEVFREEVSESGRPWTTESIQEARAKARTVLAAYGSREVRIVIDFVVEVLRP